MAEGTGDVSSSHVYDDDGQSVKKIAEAGTTLYVGAHYEIRPLPASPPPTPPPPSGRPKRAWLPLTFNNSLTIASRAGSTGPITYYYHDQLGSPVANSVGESTRYWPYGA